MRSVGGAVAVSVFWAAVWAVAGALIGIVVPSGFLDRLWLGPAIGMFPGFAFSSACTRSSVPRSAW